MTVKCMTAQAEEINAQLIAVLCLKKKKHSLRFNSEETVLCNKEINLPIIHSSFLEQYIFHAQPPPLGCELV